MIAQRHGQMANGKWRTEPSASAIRRWPYAIRLLAATLVAAIVAVSSAHSVEPGEMLKDPALEARARRLSQGLRCVVCQNQSIDDSNAPLAHDLRVIVRERLAAGDTDDQVLAYVEARYGAFVLLRPRLTPETVLLWSTPLLLLAGAAAYLLRARMRQAGERPAPVPLSHEEQRQLDALLHVDEQRHSADANGAKS